MADAGLLIRLDPTFADFAAVPDGPRLMAHTSIPIGTTWEKRNYFGHQPNVPGGPNNAGGGATNGFVITAGGVTLTRAMWLDSRPEVLAELSRLINLGKITVQDLASGAALTAEEVQYRDLPELVEQANGVVALSGVPALPGDGIDVRGYNFDIQVNPTVMPADATFQIWILDSAGTWSRIEAAVQVNDNAARIIQISEVAQQIAQRVYVEVSIYVSGTWTLNAFRRVAARV